MELNAPEVIRRNEQRMLQEAVDALIDNGSTRSGRAVAATGKRRRLKTLPICLKASKAVSVRTCLVSASTIPADRLIVAGPELKMYPVRSA